MLILGEEVKFTQCTEILLRYCNILHLWHRESLSAMKRHLAVLWNVEVITELLLQDVFVVKNKHIKVPSFHFYFILVSWWWRCTSFHCLHHTIAAWVKQNTVFNYFMNSIAVFLFLECIVLLVCMYSMYLGPYLSHFCMYLIMVTTITLWHMLLHSPQANVSNLDRGM